MSTCRSSGPSASDPGPRTTAYPPVTDSSRRNRSPSTARSWSSRGSQTTSRWSMLSRAHSTVPLNRISEPLGSSATSIAMPLTTKTSSSRSRSGIRKRSPLAGSQDSPRAASSSARARVIMRPVCRGGSTTGSRSAASWARPPVGSALPGQAAQPGVVVLEVEHQRYPGEVQPGVQQRQHPPYPVEVVLAVAAGAAVGPLRLDQATPLVHAEVLDARAGELRGHGDPVHAAAPRVLRCRHRCQPFLQIPTCLHRLPEIYKTCNRCDRFSGATGGVEVDVMLMRTDPFRDFDRLAQQVFGAGTTSRPAVMPMDAWREGDTFVIEFDLPGVQPETLDIDVERNVLTVRAERARRNGDWETLASERPTGLFSRQLVLGDNLDLDKVEASYDAGVLRLRVPVAERAKPRKIEVSTPSTSEEQTAISA